MIMATKLITIYVTILIISKLNPVSTSMMLLFFSSTIFFMMQYLQGYTWFALVFYLLFMGGILILFMVLASIMPNEKTKKNKLNKLIKFSMVMFIPMTFPAMCSNSEYLNSMKLYINSSSMMAIVMVIILMYFFLFLMILSKEKSPMRSSTCYKKKIL